VRLKPHQIGIVIALLLAAAVSVLWINGGLAGLAINGQKPDTEAIAR
jgi:hypothetical protein